MNKKNIFIVGLDDFNLKKLERLPQAQFCDFHPALKKEDIRQVENYNLIELFENAKENIDSLNCSVDGITTYYDFPATTIAPLLLEHYKLPGASLESILKCENKYWSRLEQQECIPDHIPQFKVFDPLDDDAYQKIDLLPPFWIKPVKSFRSFLAFQINDEQHFKEVIQNVREEIHFMGDPFKNLMEKFDLPQEIVETANLCLAESGLGGSMCTLEGYCYNGNVTVYGVVDSVRDQDRSSFSRYEYPTSLPLEVQHRMIEAGRNTILQIGLDNWAFNIEFFYDQTNDQVYLLEINPRISQAHTDIFEKIHGISHHSVIIDLALGNKPKVMDKKGVFNLAAHCMLRTFENGKVIQIPSEEIIQEIISKQPGTAINISVDPGQELKDLQGQDSYSFELANIFVGGRDQQDILEKYNDCIASLQFEIKYEDQAFKVSYDTHKKLSKFMRTHNLKTIEETIEILLSKVNFG